jgi:hypothetical protein
MRFRCTAQAAAATGASVPDVCVRHTADRGRAAWCKPRLQPLHLDVPGRPRRQKDGLANRWIERLKKKAFFPFISFLPFFLGGRGVLVLNPIKVVVRLSDRQTCDDAGGL